MHNSETAENIKLYIYICI